MKPILLHIGSTKTGTSSLQRFLTDNARALGRRGVLYPSAGRRAPGQMAHHNLCYEKQRSRVEAGTFKPKVGTWAEALAEIDESSTSVGIISSEAFMNCQPHQVPSVCEVLHGREARVVVYVRRQDRWLQSAWNQQARFGRTGLDFEAFVTGVAARGRGDYARMLAPWADAFGPDRVFVRNFDALAPGGIVPDFFATFLPDIEPPKSSAGEGERRNTMAGLKQLVAVSIVLESCRERLGPEFALASSSAIRMAEYFRDRPDVQARFSVLSYDGAVSVAERFAESNRRLAELSVDFRESGGFPQPKPDEYSDFVDVAALDDSIFDDEERRFVDRMITEIVRAMREPADPAPTVPATARRTWFGRRQN